MLVFRSVLVPLKAAVMNLLSIGGAYGVVVAVFQWGWGNELIGVDSTMPVEPVPADDHVRHPVRPVDGLRGVPAQPGAGGVHPHRRQPPSVVDGLASTARVITSAALIMISVFGAFLLTPDVEVKMFAIGLTVAVLVDATVVRMILVPATMALMGDANWWLPGWLDRCLAARRCRGQQRARPRPSRRDHDPRRPVGARRGGGAHVSERSERTIDTTAQLTGAPTCCRYQTRHRREVHQ